MFFLVTVHSDLVTSDNRFQSVLLAESLGHVGSELQPHSTLARSSSWCRLRICPEHLHHQSTLSGLFLVVPVELSDVIQCDVVVREQASMKNEVLVADQRGQRQRAERFREELESALVVLGLAFTLKAIHSVHVVCLVIAAVQEHGFRVQPLVSVQQEGDFARPAASVNKVSVEQVRVVG